MKHQICTLACGAALLAASAFIACGGKQTMASKSAAAYDEAKKKGTPIEAAEHGGHSAEPADAATTTTLTATMPSMGHGGMPGMSQAQMNGLDHSAMAGMDHSKMPGMNHDTGSPGARGMAGMDHSAMAGMDRSKMLGMQHGVATAGPPEMAGMAHSTMPGMEHGSMPGMQQGGAMAAMPGMQHGSSQAAPFAIPPLTSNASIAQTQPAATLRPDEFDAPAPSAVEEAAKGASGMGHSMEMAAPSPPVPLKQEHTPKNPAVHHDHGGEAS